MQNINCGRRRAGGFGIRCLGRRTRNIWVTTLLESYWDRTPERACLLPVVCEKNTPPRRSSWTCPEQDSCHRHAYRIWQKRRVLLSLCSAVALLQQNFRCFVPFAKGWKSHPQLILRMYIYRGIIVTFVSLSQQPCLFLPCATTQNTPGMRGQAAVYVCLVTAARVFSPNIRRSNNTKIGIRLRPSLES